MTLSLSSLALYAGALFVLFLTPGPVWLALTARAISGGFAAAWPLALGVSVGDLGWPLLAIFGLSVVTTAYGTVMLLLRWAAVAIFMAMGVGLIRKAGKPIEGDSRLTRPGRWAGFAAGVTAILGNPKAILFYMGVLPGFFDLRHFTPPDVAAVVFLSMLVPLIGNFAFAALVARARHRLTGQSGMARLNRIAGGLLICVAVLIAVT
ncbi:LysE family translocator [Acidimangrovimonas sediminis]|uniref:LysE family translocator n=1 Tax=Acidimangrovimonas sediminis TaxID=2056283 RepID=UPI000C7FB162|nr:LysE family translocator [Acidimangrovimonas sediminis]